MIFAVVIFAVAYLMIAWEKINKTLIALLGASVMLIFHVLPQEVAMHHIDFNVITLLISMMVLVSIVEQTGVFEFVAIKLAKLVGGSPIKILVMLFLITAVFSALLDNITTVLLIAPVSVLIAEELRISPLPFLLSQIFASNIGGTATLIGDPPNIMIGSAAGLTFMDFVLNVAPLVVLQLVLIAVLFYFLFGRQMRVSNEDKARIMAFDERRSIKDLGLLFKSLLVLGLVKGASKGEGLGNKFLANIRQVEAIVHVVRCFEDENVAHVSGEVDPVSDVQTINLELMLADQQFLSRQIEKATKQLKADKSVAARLELLEKIFAQLDQEKAIRDLELTDDEKAIVKSLNLLSAKPVLYVANVGEEDVVDGNDYVQKLKGLVGDDQVLLISASIENEIAQLEPEEKKEFLQDLGLSRSGLDKIVLRSYKLLNLVSFLTAGEKEVRAWTIKKGTLAPEAAGKIHSDIQRGFIRAETISFDEFKNVALWLSPRAKVCFA